MTTALSMICCDGLVIGTDMKVTGGGTKAKDEKLLIDVKLGGRALAISVAGRLRHTKDAIAWMEFTKLDEILGDNADFDDFLDKIVETRLPQYARDFQNKYGERPEISLLIGCVDKHDTARLIEIYPDGDYDYKDKFAAIGSGSIFGEILLRKLYDNQITCEIAKRLIGYIIWEIQDIDNDSGEDMQIASIDKKGQLERVSYIEIETYKQLPEILSPSYHEIRRRIENMKLDEVKDSIQSLHEAIKKAST